MTRKTKEYRWEANQQPLDLQPKTLPLRHRYLQDTVNVFKTYKKNFAIFNRLRKIPLQ
jgi:hypothetical protein